FPFADHLRPAPKVDLVIPADALSSARSAHLDRRLYSSRRHGGCRRCTRSGAGRLCFAGSTLIESHVECSLPNAHKLDVDTVLELRPAPNLFAQLAPVCREVVDKNHKVRITHRNAGSADSPSAQRKRQFALGFRFSHGSFEFEA